MRTRAIARSIGYSQFVDENDNTSGRGIEDMELSNQGGDDIESDAENSIASAGDEQATTICRTSQFPGNARTCFNICSTGDELLNESASDYLEERTQDN